MSWLRKMFHPRVHEVVEVKMPAALEHQQIIKRADRVIREYQKMDGVMKLYVRRGR